MISEGLRGEFEKYEFPLSPNTTISTGEKRGNRWLIADESRKRTYTLKGEEAQLNVYYGSLPHLNLEANYLAILRCFSGFLLFLISLYLMGFFLYLEERESGRIMKNVKSFVKLREFFDRHEKRG